MKELGVENEKFSAHFEKLEVQITEIKAEIEKYRGQGVNTENQRKKILKDLEDKLQKLGDDQKPKKAMGRIVRRLERKLNEMGYEMGSLLGKAYRDGMTCYPEFISSDDPAHTEPVITRALLPQVFHLGKLIQVPKIQVSEHYESVTNE